MLHDTATSAAIDWKAPAANINAAIEAVRIKFLSAATPNTEVMSLNLVTGLLRVDPLSDMPKDHLSDAMAQLKNVLDLFDFDTVTGNYYSPIEAEWWIIRRAVDAYADRPRMLYSACQRTITRLEVEFATGVCPSPGQDADISDLYETVMRLSVDLLERDSQVKEVVTARAAGKLAEITKDMVEVLQNGTLELSQISEGSLANESPCLVDALTDASTDADEKAETLYILGSRFLRGGSWLMPFGAKSKPV